MVSVRAVLIAASVLGLTAAVPAGTPTFACTTVCVTPTVTSFPTEIHCPLQPAVTIPCPRYQCIKESTRTATSTHFCHGDNCDGVPTASCDALTPVTVLGNPCYTGCPVPCPVPVTTVGIACPVGTPTLA